MALREDTRDLHHACEQHAVGAAMSDGSVDEQTWTDWLGCLFVVHSFLDYHLPIEMRRVFHVKADLHAMASRGFTPRANNAALEFTAMRMKPDAAAYVFGGAHLMGGAVMEKRLGDRLPCEHLRWYDRRAAIDVWRPMRERDDLTQPARDTFAAILEMMDEIYDRPASHPA